MRDRQERRSLGFPSAYAGLRQPSRSLPLAARHKPAGSKDDDNGIGTPVSGEEQGARMPLGSMRGMG